MLKYSPLVVIVGTTGVGKSQFSIELAKKLGGEIINADSMQMYKGCEIITNKHPTSERQGIPHHVMDHVDWQEEYFIHRFQKEASDRIARIRAAGKVPIVVGGTSYYLQSLLFKNRTVAKDASLANKQEKLKTFTEEQQQILNSQAYSYLVSVDPEIANRYHPNDERRIKRLLEIYFESGKRPSEIFTDQGVACKLVGDTLVYWLWLKQDVLNDRLDARVDSMVEQGALQEMQQLYSVYKANHLSGFQNGIWQVIGFKEFFPWLEGGLSEADSVEKMKTKTRQYSKRQIKWIKNSLIKELQTVDLHDTKCEVHLLDATDLGQWDDQVKNKGLEIYERFGQLDMEVGQNIEMLSTESKPNARKQYTCDVCMVDGKPLILIGEERMTHHLRSRRHKKSYYRKLQNSVSYKKVKLNIEHQ